MARDEADQSERLLKMEAGQDEATVKVNLDQPMDDERDMGLGMGDNLCNFPKWGFGVCVYLCVLVFIVATNEKSFSNNWDLRVIFYVLASASICHALQAYLPWRPSADEFEKKHRSTMHRFIEEHKASPQHRHNYNMGMRNFCIIYIPYYLSIIVMMIKVVDAKYNWVYCCGLSISLMGYASLIKKVVVTEWPSTYGTSCTDKLRWLIHSSLFIAIAMYALITMAPTVEDLLSLFQNA